MGCCYGQRYKTANARTWSQLLAWDPDFALVQETYRPDIDSDRFVFTPYDWSDEIGTLVYAKAGPLVRPLVDTPLLAHLAGQVTLAETELNGTAYLLASIHANTAKVDPDRVAEFGLVGVGGSHTADLYPLDLIRNDLSRLTQKRRFIVGGDLNAALRFDQLYPKNSVYYGNLEWFTKAHESGWWNAHRKFHAGEERTLFRPNKPDELFQLDHLFTDRTTWSNLTRCDVLPVPFLDELTDHAPLVMEVGPPPPVAGSST